MQSPSRIVAEKMKDCEKCALLSPIHQFTHRLNENTGAHNENPANRSSPFVLNGASLCHGFVMTVEIEQENDHLSCEVNWRPSNGHNLHFKIRYNAKILKSSGPGQEKLKNHHHFPEIRRLSKRRTSRTKTRETELVVEQKEAVEMIRELNRFVFESLKKLTKIPDGEGQRHCREVTMSFERPGTFRDGTSQGTAVLQKSLSLCRPSHPCEYCLRNECSNPERVWILHSTEKRLLALKTEASSAGESLKTNVDSSVFYLALR
jgi:hypothetical protein